MFLRMTVVTAVLQPRLAWSVAFMLSWLALASFGVAGWQWRQVRDADPAGRMAATDMRVFDLPAAFGFAALLGTVAVAVRFAREQLGDVGLLGAAFVSGLVDVDAILISTIQLQAQGEVAAPLALSAVTLAVLANMVSKAVLAWAVGGPLLGRKVLAGYLAIAAAAALALVGVRL